MEEAQPSTPLLDHQSLPPAPPSSLRTTRKRRTPSTPLLILRSAKRLRILPPLVSSTAPNDEMEDVRTDRIIEVNSPSSHESPIVIDPSPAEDVLPPCLEGPDSAATLALAFQRAFMHPGKREQLGWDGSGGLVIPLQDMGSSRHDISRTDNTLMSRLRQQAQFPATSPPPTGSSWKSSLSGPPHTSDHVTDPGAFSLADFCFHVRADQTLRYAKISYTESYTVWTSRGVVHRFVLFEIDREGQAPIWVKLERRPSQSFFYLMLRFGVCPTLDQVFMSVDKNSLVQAATCENRQAYGRPPTLERVTLLLLAIAQDLSVYSLWSENCYFFCSLIQQRLGDAFNGAFVHGLLPHRHLASTVRQHIEQRLPLYRISYGHPITELLESAVTMGWAGAQSVVNFPRLLMDPANTNFASRTILAYRLCEFVFNANYELNQAQKYREALVLHEATYHFLVNLRDWSSLNSDQVIHSRRQHYGEFLWLFVRLLQDTAQAELSCVRAAEDVALARLLCMNDPTNHRDTLTIALEQYGISLRKAGRSREACDAGAESVSLMRLLYARDSETHRFNFSLCLQQYGISLRKAGRSREACNAGSEDVSLMRFLYAKDPETHRFNSSVSLHHYGVSLREAGRSREACDAGAEAVFLWRMLFASDPETHHLNLSISLHQYGISLREAGRLSEACDAGAEGVSLKRLLYAINPERFRRELAVALYHCAVSLRSAKRFREACDAGAEDITLGRILYASDPERFCWDLADSLNEYGISLCEAERYGDACDASAEAVSLARSLYELDSNKWKGSLRAYLRSFAAALRGSGRNECAEKIKAERDAMLSS